MKSLGEGKSGENKEGGGNNEWGHEEEEEEEEEEGESGVNRLTFAFGWPSRVNV